MEKPEITRTNFIRPTEIKYSAAHNTENFTNFTFFLFGVNFLYTLWLVLVP